MAKSRKPSSSATSRAKAAPKKKVSRQRLDVAEECSPGFDIPRSIQSRFWSQVRAGLKDQGVTERRAANVVSLYKGALGEYAWAALHVGVSRTVQVLRSGPWAEISGGRAMGHRTVA